MGTHTEQRRHKSDLALPFVNSRPVSSPCSMGSKQMQQHSMNDCSNVSFAVVLPVCVDPVSPVWLWLVLGFCLWSAQTLRRRWDLSQGRMWVHCSSETSLNCLALTHLLSRGWIKKKHVSPLSYNLSDSHSVFVDRRQEKNVSLSKNIISFLWPLIKCLRLWAPLHRFWHWMEQHDWSF